MDAWVWIVLAALVVIAVIALIWMTMRQRRTRTERLRQKYGSEYDHVVDGESTRERRAGEEQLERREQRRQHLQIHPLSPQSRERYSNEWGEVQRRFVDEPERSVEDAEHLVTQVMGERGYPVADEFENQAELVSVDHPRLVANYRRAHTVYERSRRNEATTEQLRSSLVDYRSLFDELLEDSGSTRDPRADSIR